MDIQPIDIPRQAGIYVRRAREVQGLTRKQLAECAGVSERLLASLELGYAEGIRLDKLLAVLGALGISLLAQGECIERASFDAHREVRAAGGDAGSADRAERAAGADGRDRGGSGVTPSQSGDPWVQGPIDDAPRFADRVRHPAPRRKRKPISVDWSSSGRAAYDEMLRSVIEDMGYTMKTAASR